MSPPAESLAWDPGVPTLYVAADWIEQHCIVPDGFRKGAPFLLYDWQLYCTLHHYRVRPDAVPAGTVKPDGTIVAPAAAFHNRRSQIVAPQKTGKGPWSATVICLEAVGPAVFSGFADADDGYACSEHGCSCGWEYPYEPGEPMATEWPTPLIQLLATAEDQTDNVYRPLQSMARNGPLAERMTVGEEFIRLPNDGRIDVVTSSALARLGNPTTFALQDETQLYTRTNKLVTVAETQRRGVAGMGGRTMETTNAWDPTEDTTARRTAESKAPDIWRFHRLAPADLSYKNKRERRKIHRIVYEGSNHVDLDVIEREAFELLEKDAAQAERFFGNRLVAGAGTAFNADRWAELGAATAGHRPANGELIVIGVDGARFHDALAIVATDVVSGHQWPPAIIERPENAPDDYEHDFEAADRAMLDAFDAWQVWRVYIDPQYIEKLVERWQGRWGEKVVIEWLTFRQRPMAFALQSYRAAMTGGDVTNDGNLDMARHIANATKRAINVRDDEGHPLWLIDKPEQRRKIDAAMAGALSWEARSDALAKGAKKTLRGQQPVLL